MNVPVDPVLQDCRQRLINAAAEAFKEVGYRASIDTIAARAGVARQTVYNHFASKDDLFSEVANIAAISILVSLDGDGRNLRERLIRFGMTFRQRLIGDEGLALFRTVSAEAPRFPDLARAFFDKGAGQTIRRLAEFLARAMDEGTLRRDDPEFATETLLSMLDCCDRTRRLLGAAMLPDDAERARVERIIDCFLRAFAPNQQRTVP
ncbi:MAG: TetR/AcrR family transcriptional regulator [Betaproteobacteria bacterium]|nr:TetR/AcrR family transcriptional regulator [Betaproteobacteria bacterium]